MKRILDTVHGYIMIDEKFINSIINTVYFQRLRRIEQTSIRSIYPSARHDRFIHSLGVFHIGTLIVNQLQAESKKHNNWKVNKKTLSSLFDSYLSACLLHDIGHAPFSHTFEEYFGDKSELASILKEEICKTDPSFDIDLYSIIENGDEPNFHEYVSAIVAYRKFKKTLVDLGQNSELVVRMITGVLYEKEKEKHQLQNCLISLLHGKVIDSDRLDYACRDVWASGYSTSKIDLRRLISALHIEEKDHLFVVCFESNALNEIEGLRNVKDFQVKYVINHHVVVYEQWLMKQAAEQMAYNLFPTSLDCHEALEKIININSITDSTLLPNGLKICNISDDDLVFLLKQETDNPYYNEWSSRSFKRRCLWKTIDEFYHFFPKIKRRDSLGNKNFIEKVSESFKTNNIINFVILEATFKPKVKINDLYIKVLDRVVKYSDFYPEMNAFEQSGKFYYVYVPLEYDRKEIIDSLRELL